jgi:hypothetical protein
MARQQQKDYKFTPGTAGVGTVKIPGNYESADILTILNATDQVFIYNFADPDLGAIVTFSKNYDASFPQAQDGVTTITLDISTVTMSADDSLAIYIETEAQYIRPWPFGTDAVERMRVSTPQSLIDADFEYGLQNTKWQSLSLNNDVPSLYELPGSELTIDTAGYATFLGTTLSNSTDTTCDFTNQTGLQAPNWVQDDYALIVDPHKANQPTATWVTANAVSSNQRTLTVANTAAFVSGDELVIVGIPTTANTTLATTAITSGATTTFALTSTNGITVDMMLAVETNTTNLWELVMVTGVASPNITVVRRRLQTNTGNVNINIGNQVRPVSNVEIAQIQTIESNVAMSVNRGYKNTTSLPNLISGSIIQKLNLDLSTASGGNVEIVKMSVVGTAAGNATIVARGQLGTTALSVATEGTLAIRLQGVFQAGNVDVNQIGVAVTNNQHSANAFISVGQLVNSNSEGLYQITAAQDNYFFYFPRRSTGLQVGTPLNKFDTQVRKAAAFAVSTLNTSTITSDAATPSTITVTTPYAHGISPGTPILVDITNTFNNRDYVEGSFTVLSIPSTTSFTFQAKSGRAVPNTTITANIYIRPSAFFVHRPFDGGVLIGSGTPHRGAMAARQSKKYFRYQSGKGLVWTSGTLLSTNFDVVNVAATGTAVSGNSITITTEIEHYLQIGANIKLDGVITSGYNGFYRVANVVSDSTFSVSLNSTLGSSIPVLDNQPKVNLMGWHGGAVRAGIFDEQNGAFWENNGVNINVVLRSATFQLAGTLSTEVSSQFVTGDGSCRFLEQLKIYDRVVIRGMSHTVTAITDNNTMTVSPPWRGIANQTRVKASRVIDNRVPQSEFNLDKVDGTGPSGYILDASKMQMLLIQYTWYGAGFVDYGLRGPLGNYIMCHRIQNNNVNDEAYFRSGNLPVRYSANNEGTTARLAIAANAVATSITIDSESAGQFPLASVDYPFYVQIENEVVKCSSHTLGSTTLNNLTRGATFSLWQDGQSRSFTMGTAASHSANVGVSLLDCTSSPTLNHWGSAVIMDGGFDQDRGYAFTYSRNNMALPTTTDAKSTVFLMRLAPSVSNTIIGDIGTRDLINRAQLLLESMFINVTGGRMLVEGILNPTNITSTSIGWTNLNIEATGNQPSFTQFATAFTFSSTSAGGVVPSAITAAGGFTRSGIAPGIATNLRYINYVKIGEARNPGATTTSVAGIGANISIAKTATTSTAVNQFTTSITVHELGSGYLIGDQFTIPGNLWSTSSSTFSTASGTSPTNDVTLTVLSVAAGVSGGERLFAIPVSTTNSGFLDLTKVKQIGTSAIPGTGVFPDGPEVLAIQVTAISGAVGSTGDFQITFSETQA